jgi:hypothetical protein
MRLGDTPAFALISIYVFGCPRLLNAAIGDGPNTCIECHKNQVEHHANSHHAHSLAPLGNSPLEKLLLNLRQSPDGRLQYSSDGSQIAISETGVSNSATLEWAFGAGAQGITPVGRFGQLYFEHQFSYYTVLKGLAPTFGHPARVHTPLAEIGIVQNGREISRCFNCHATGSRDGSDGPDVTAMVPGIQCERCHGSGKQHVSAAKSGAPTATIVRDIANPGRYSAKVKVEFCGQCHRLPPADAVDEPEMENPISIRFAPVGLMASRCFKESKSLSCLTCHDPHSNAKPRTSMSYSSQCMKCHASSTAAIRNCRRKDNQNCLNCHMKQASLGPYLRFTDHRIRIY